MRRITLIRLLCYYANLWPGICLRLPPDLIDISNNCRQDVLIEHL